MEEKTNLSDASASSSSPDPSSSSKITAVARVQRNVAEKQRRDKLNGYISELATIVPIVSKAAKRMDKTSILRLSAAYLRICKSPLSGRKRLKSFKWCPSFLNPDQVRDILESVDGFLLVAESNGKILFTSRSVERYLGHQDIDIVGHTIYMFIHPEDVEMVKSELNSLLFAFSEKDCTNKIPRCSFYCRMKEKNQPRSEVQTYQFVHIMGAMTPIEEESASENSPRKASPTFKAFIRVVDADPYNQLSLEEAIADEYITRHSLDGTIIFADHRISTITGHMPHEVTGFNAYKFIHTEDTSVTLFAHHLMFSSDKGTGMIVYRLRTRDDKYVYLKTVGCLQYDSCTSQVDHFVCVNQQLGDMEGKSQLKYFTDQYIPHIKGNSTSSLFESVKALQMSSSKTSPAQNGNNMSTHKNTKVVTKELDVISCQDSGHSNANTIIIDDSRQSEISSSEFIQGDSLLDSFSSEEKMKQEKISK
ncbi:protein cycle isoform X1 [Parasteatoda tepidariorum]